MIKQTDEMIKKLSQLEQLPPFSPSTAVIEETLAAELSRLRRKIVVLDDDPTGVQTVHDVSVYTEWSAEALKKGFREENSLFFILTNSRAMTSDETARVHRDIASALCQTAAATGRDFIVISRSDSTLRGHYPLETALLREEIEACSAKIFDGEIIVPFFEEGGRYTLENVHYVQDGDLLYPAAQTEFAQDKSFGYHHSNLREWVEEKTGGRYLAKDTICIDLQSLREYDIDGICAKLCSAGNFQKIIVNAVENRDIKVFVSAFLKALSKGKEFLFRSAAAVPKILGGITDKPLLTKGELVAAENKNGGVILIGSHVNKTTKQLAALKGCHYPLEFIEFNQHLVMKPQELAAEVDRVVAKAQTCIESGKTVAVYTRRDRFNLATEDKELQLKISVEISDAVTGIIARLNARPNFIIAKGGITSSDVGTKALGVKRAVVMGQIQPGIPVWMTGAESKFPHMPYIIFPGNVGEADSLKQITETLLGPVAR